MVRSNRRFTITYMYLSIAALVTAPSSRLQNAGRSVPPPARLMRNGVREMITSEKLLELVETGHCPNVVETRHDEGPQPPAGREPRKQPLLERRRDARRDLRHNGSAEACRAGIDPSVPRL